MIAAGLVMADWDASLGSYRFMRDFACNLGYISEQPGRLEH